MRENGDAAMDNGNNHDDDDIVHRNNSSNNRHASDDKNATASYADEQHPQQQEEEDSSAAAFVLESLLHELTFWEATPKEFLMRKSQSVNDVSDTAAVSSSLVQQTQSSRSSSGKQPAAVHQSQKRRSSLGSSSQQQQHLQNQNSSNDFHRRSAATHEASSSIPQQQPQSSSYATAQLHGQPLEPQQPKSPTLAELQAACTWHKAVDPATGRTYYYDMETRKTQWEKPREIRVIEKKAKKEQRQKLEIFFREMEQNILASLARGECIPLQKTMVKEGPPLEPYNNSYSSSTATAHNNNNNRHQYREGGAQQQQPQNTARVRTISGMNEHLLAQIQQQQPHPTGLWHHPQAQPQHLQLLRVMSTSPGNTESGRPPLPRPPPTAGSTATSLISHNGSFPKNVIEVPNGILNNTSSNNPSTSTVLLPPKQQQQLQVLLSPSTTTTIQQHLQEHSLSLLHRQMSTSPDDLELSPEDDHNNAKRPLGEDSLRGEEFVDRLMADLEVSDDEDDSTGVAMDGAAYINGVQQQPSKQDATTNAVGTASSSSLMTTVDGTTSHSSSTSETKDGTAAVTRKSSRTDKNGLAPLVHMRRNTAGSVHQAKCGTTMDKPDIDATIHVVCGVIRAHIEQSMVHSRTTPSPNVVRVNLDMFRDDYECADTSSSSSRRRDQSHSSPSRGNSNNNSSNGHHHEKQQQSMPTLDEIKAFYREFYQRSQMEFDAIIMSLIYVERLIKETNGALMPTPDNWGSVVFSCMVLASKVWDDLSMWNIDFSNVSVNSSLLSSFSLKRINQLELAVLTCLNFAVTIPGSEYAKYYYLLRNMMIRGGLLDPFAANQTLTNDDKNRLEDRTNRYQALMLSQDENTRRRVKSVDWSVLPSSTTTTVSSSSSPESLVDSTSTTTATATHSQHHTNGNGASLMPAVQQQHTSLSKPHDCPDIVTTGPGLHETLCLEKMLTTR